MSTLHCLFIKAHSLFVVFDLMVSIPSSIITKGPWALFIKLQKEIYCVHFSAFELLLCNSLDEQYLFLKENGGVLLRTTPAEFFMNFPDKFNSFSVGKDSNLAKALSFPCIHRIYTTTLYAQDLGSERRKVNNLCHSELNDHLHPTKATTDLGFLKSKITSG